MECFGDDKSLVYSIKIISDLNFGRDFVIFSIGEVKETLNENRKWERTAAEEGFHVQRRLWNGGPVSKFFLKSVFSSLLRWI